MAGSARRGALMCRNLRLCIVAHSKPLHPATRDAIQSPGFLRSPARNTVGFLYRAVCGCFFRPYLTLHVPYLTLAKGAVPSKIELSAPGFFATNASQISSSKCVGRIYKILRPSHLIKSLSRAELLRAALAD